MEKFVIEGGRPLRGSVTPSGNKNSALPLLAACLLTDEPVTLRNVPQIDDVRTMRHLLTDLGATFEDLDPHTWRIHAREIRKAALDPELCKRIRASILLAGPMLARVGQIELPPPGGDVIGRRRVDTHLLALEALGAAVRVNNGFHMQTSGLRAADVLLDEASVTGTENAVMAAALAPGRSVIRNAASEPHVQELCHLINAMGGHVENIGSNMLIVEGVPKLHGGEFAVGPDYLEVASFIGAAAVTGGEIRIRQAGLQYLDMIRLVFRRLGVQWTVDGDDLLVPASQPLAIVPDLGNAIPEITDLPWPGFPADVMSIAIVVATQAAGTALFHEWMYESRLFFVDRLIGMGARIVLCDPHRCLVQGPARLQAEAGGLASPDIRAGMALIIAALCARGQSVIRNIGQIERGYERIEEKLKGLGAAIERVED
ncbi:MAG: UDP-N-acetylglucosamine 1-carboxyvinyltransferase [Chloroflexi bacterium]|nr:UDP-N-acetylglucosamine 1-carboxyvinyltransferase [Chloroflexota bacterium]